MQQITTMTRRCCYYHPMAMDHIVRGVDEMLTDFTSGINTASTRDLFDVLRRHRDTILPLLDPAASDGTPNVS